MPRQGEPVRARWERDAKGEADQAVNAEWALVELLAGPDWRLLVTGEKNGKATAEVAHEILLKTWPTLKLWLEEERDFLIWRGELDARQEEYEKAGKAGARRQRQALLMGLPLDTAEKWLAARRGDIEPAARAFIEASQRADRDVARRWQWLQGAVGLLLVCIIGGLLARMYERELREQIFWATTFRGHALKAAEILTLKPGQQFAECIEAWSDDQKTHRIRRYCPDMVVLPAGSFRMGDSPDTPSARAILRSDESPARTVTIAQPFAVSKFAVTFDQWDACVDGGGCDSYRPYDDHWGRGTRPVIYVSWDNAQRYVDWLKRMSGTKSYRLLSEAEFEYAARAGTSTDYPWGDVIGKNNANCQRCGSHWDGKQTAPAGSFKANLFNLYEMHGNVWESVGSSQWPSKAEFVTIWVGQVKEPFPHVRTPGGPTSPAQSLFRRTRFLRLHVSANA